MRPLLRQAALTAMFVACLYLLMLAATSVIEPSPPQLGWLDLSKADDTLYLTGPKYVVLARDVLDIPEPKVMVLGGSNALIGFRRDELQALVPNAKISILALGNSNISEISELITLVHEVQDEKARRSDIFVIGAWFGLFVDSDVRWAKADRRRGDTDLDVELYRYGFYRRTADGPVAVLPPQWLRLGVTLVRPYLMVEKLVRDLTWGARQSLLRRHRELTDPEREAAAADENSKREALAYWRQAVGATGAISPAQVALLRQTIDAVLRAGEKVVLVDLPIPAWHRDASPFEAGYERAMHGILDEFAGRPGFASLRMPDLDADQDYSDEVHPKPHLARIWAARLADTLKSIAGPAITAADRQAGVTADGKTADRAGVAAQTPLPASATPAR